MSDRAADHAVPQVREHVPDIVKPPGVDRCWYGTTGDNR